MQEMDKNSFLNNSLDARVVLLSFFLAVFFIWRVHDFLLPFLCVLYLFVFIRKSKQERKSTAGLKTLIKFCFSWFILIFLVSSVDLYNVFLHGGSIYYLKYNFLFAFLFVLRLFTVSLIGLSLFLWASAREYSFAFAWFFGFFFKEQGWKVGLISLLILKFFPELLKLCKEIKKSVDYRIKKASFFKKISLYFSTLLRIMTKKNYTLSLALYSRGLNRPEMFQKDWNTLNLKEHDQILAFALLPFLFVILEDGYLKIVYDFFRVYNKVI